ncbi:Sodium:solute symporter family-domain-containing protein [Hygrophoropsis aurantiaca]|uniref:Sodium:solute symporter family-domain-containing protein n=1 Tax=Hygrophoropsis aurantiaca TaxID=72124 RepID=A0ACB8A282_9AGAM|nr:Sodium:solute symporter family-domain-containing protein [Hygrophoropsis aurantiaca]
MSNTSDGAQILSLSVGYGVVLGIGFAFALFMILLSTLQNRYTTFKLSTPEEFNTASRSIKPGLLASGIVSAWTWAATLLQSSTITYEYGLSGAYYYAAGATLQIFLMAVLAVRVKMVAPYCHTYLEIIHARYEGSAAHIVFACFGLTTNLIASSMMLVGGSAVLNAFTGMNVYAANFLIPLGVAVYVILGGLRATFLCDYSHTLILMIVIFYFYFYTYCESSLIGGLDGMYHLLEQAGQRRPVAGNEGGSYLTMKSNYGLVFMAIQIAGSFGNCMLDQGYWQRAIASKTQTAVRAYIMGGIAWFAVPITFSTTMGLAAVALTDSPSFPYYPGGLSTAQVSAGLAAPAGVVTLLGKGGAAAMLILLFMAVTSAASSEMIATSSILTFDIYQIHFRPNASPESLVRVSHIMVAVWALTMSCTACLWNGIGLSLNWLFLFIGTVTTGAVGPVVLTVLWRKQSKVAAIGGALGGLCVGVVCWLVVAKVHFGELSVETTGESYSMLAGNLGSFCSGPIISVIITLFKPDNDFDWSQTRRINHNINKLRGESQVASPTLSVKNESEESGSFSHAIDDLPEDYAVLEKSFKVACYTAIIMSFIIVILIPIPMFLSHYIFSLQFFRAWVVISVVWLFVAACITSVLPLWESRQAIMDIGRGLTRDLFRSGAK